MPIGNTAWGDAITDVGTSQLYPIGTIREEASNDAKQFWRYVKIDTGVTVAVGLAVKLKDAATYTTGVVLGTTNGLRAKTQGIVQHVIAAGSYGWVLCKGWGTGQSDGSTTASTGQTLAASGQLTDTVIGTNECIGFAAETESPAGAGGTFRMYVDCM